MTSSVSDLPTVVERRMTGRGVPLFPDEPQTLSELFVQAARKHDRTDALSYKRDGEWRHISSKQLLERVGHVALGLHSLGLIKGDRVAILATNSPEWTLADAACQFAGLLDVPIYPTLAPHSIKYILNDSGARILIIENKEAFGRIREVIADCRTVERFVFFDSGSVDNGRSISFAELETIGKELDACDADLIENLSREQRSNNVATVIYTSGTTG